MEAFSSSAHPGSAGVPVGDKRWIYMPEVAELDGEGSLADREH
jgi:hypothetical protein